MILDEVLRKTLSLLRLQFLLAISIFIQFFGFKWSN